MSLQELVVFAQKHICADQLKDREEPIQADPTSFQDFPPLPGSPFVDTNFTAPRQTDMPNWLAGAENIDRIDDSGVGARIVLEGIEGAISQPTGNQHPHGADALAYYLPYHFYRPKTWGIYLRAKGILELAADLKGAALKPGDESIVEAAKEVLFHHEYFHCATEAAATCAEVVTHSILPNPSLYRRYFFDVHACPIEEAMANAYAYRKIQSKHKSLAASLGTWMRKQGKGYRDFDRFVKGRNFREGQAVCTQHILRFVSTNRQPPWPLPPDALFGNVPVSSIPTYLVIENNVRRQVVREFPKYVGILVKVHSNDHPPPHIHIEMPPGEHKTKYRWPELSPVDGQLGLSGQEQEKFNAYLERYGDKIHQRMCQVYGPSLQMPEILRQPT